MTKLQTYHFTKTELHEIVKKEAVKELTQPMYDTDLGKSENTKEVIGAVSETLEDGSIKVHVVYDNLKEENNAN